MPPDVTNVTNAELAVLQTLWERGPCTIRQIADILYPGGKAAQYGTVQKLLERLEDKKCVTRDNVPWPHVFSAAVDRATLIGWRLRDTAEKLCGGSLTPILLHLLDAEQYDEEERLELRSFLEQLQKQKPTNDPGS